MNPSRYVFVWEVAQLMMSDGTHFEKEAYLLYVLMLLPLRLEIKTAEPAVDVLGRSSLALLALVLHQAVKRSEPRTA
jgi:hypothetical protein